MLDGVRIHWIWSDSDEEYYLHESVFASREMYEKYGKYAIHSRDCNLLSEAELDGFRTTSEETLPESVVVALIKEGIPEQQWTEILFTSDSRDLISKTNRLNYTVYSASAKVKRMGDFAQEEENMRASNRNLSNQASSTDYSGPLFVYDIDTEERPSESAIAEQRGPINTSWKQSLQKQAKDVESEMKGNGWGLGIASQAPWISGQRHVIIDDGSSLRFKNEDAQVGKIQTSVVGQYHTRLYDIPDPMDAEFQVAGQAHKDPAPLHGQVSSPSSWHFSRSRDEVGQDWQNLGYNVPTVQINNQNQFPSNKGNQDQVQ